MQIHPIKIGELVFPPVLAAPMVGVTDYPFRLILRDFFNGLAFAEMLSAEAVTRDNQRTMKMAKLEDGLTGIQLVGCNPKVMASAARKAEEMGATLVDVNAGCPDPNTTKKGGGAALMKDPELLQEIVSSVGDAVDVPFTVKIRSGWDTAILEDLAESVIASGAKMVTIHPRLAAEGYRSTADHSRTKRFVELIDGKIPVVVSGDIWSEKDACDTLELTGAQGVMVARGMRGDPQLPQRIIEQLEGKEPVQPHIIDKCRWLLIHARHCIDYHGIEPGIRIMRKHTFWYTRGIPKWTYPRDLVNKMETFEELEKICRMILQNTD